MATGLYLVRHSVFYLAPLFNFFCLPSPSFSSKRYLDPKQSPFHQRFPPLQHTTRLTHFSTDQELARCPTWYHISEERAYIRTFQGQGQSLGVAASSNHSHASIAALGLAHTPLPTLDAALTTAYDHLRTFVPVS